VSLILFATETVCDALQIESTTVPWLDIISITFRLRQPEAASATD
jgi:hypothetical protein